MWVHAAGEELSLGAGMVLSIYLPGVDGWGSPGAASRVTKVTPEQAYHR